MGRGLRIVPAAALALAATSASAAPLLGQEGPLKGGLALGLAPALGDFRDHVDVAFGLTGHLAWGLERSGVLALRIDGGALTYGRETDAVPLSRTVGRVNVDVTTSNNIAMLAIGPQVQATSGGARPYAHALVGLSYFFTESSATGTSDFIPFARSTNYSDFTPALAVGGGLYIPLGSRIALDLGAQLRSHGTTRYLTEGSIEEDGEGDVSFTPIESRTDILLFRAGVAFGLW